MGAYLPLPHVYEREGRQERAWDIYSRLLRDRIVFIGTPIDDFVANSIIAQLLFLQMEDPKKDVHIYINSPGGSVSDGMAIYDTLNFMQCDIVTYCLGMAASMSTVLLSAGTKGKRFALPNSRIMIHQPSGGAGGQTSDISIAALMPPTSLGRNFPGDVRSCNSTNSLPTPLGSFSQLSFRHC